MTDKLKRKVDRAIRFLQSIKSEEIELSYSGGKDSDVILELAKMAGIKFRAIYKNTTIDPPYTIKHVREKGVEIIQPKKSFAQLIQQKGFPNRFMRFCCSELKEYPILSKSIQGIRRDESVKRAKRYLEPTYCRVYNKNSKVEVFMPILEWDKDDIKEFVETYNVKCHPLYYDENGIFHVERRLGCMCCPLASRKNRLKEFIMHPHMVKFYIKNGQRYMDSHPECSVHKRFKDIYEWFTMDLFTDNLAQFKQKFGGDNLFGEKIDCKKYLENYFNVKL